MAHCFPPWGEVHTHRNHGKFDSHDRATDSPSRTIVDFSGELLTICILDIVTEELIIKRRRQELHNGIHNGIHMAQLAQVAALVSTEDHSRVVLLYGTDCQLCPHASNCGATIMSPCKPSFHDAASNAILLPHSHHKCSPDDTGIIVSL